MKDRSLLVSPILGAMIFATGLGLAMWRLPEWRTRRLPDRSVLERRMDEVLARAGLRRTGRIGYVGLSGRSLSSDSENPTAGSAYEKLGPAAADWLLREGRGFFVRMVAPAAWADGGGDGVADVTLGTNATPASLLWVASKWSGFVSVESRAKPVDRDDALASALLGPGEHLGAKDTARIAGSEIRLREIEPGSPLHETVAITEPGLIEAERLVGSVAQIRSRIEAAASVRHVVAKLPIGAAQGLLALGIVVLFIALLVQRRIAFANAAILALVVGVCALPAMSGFAGLGWYQWIEVGAVVGGVLWALVVWASTESWLRSREPGLVAPLDVLRHGRLGPRSGRALILGWAFGAAVAGIWLGLVAAATLLAGVRPTRPTIGLPIFGSSSLVLMAVTMTGAIVLAHMVGVLVKGWWLPVAAGIGAFVMAPRIHVAPYPFRLTIALAMTGLLLVALKRSGLVGLLVASLEAVALPAAVFSTIHAGWMPGTLAGSALFAIGPLAVGGIGLSRSREAEATRLEVPGFVRRLEQERRIRYEMDLLSAMQLRLLPQAPPRLEGWDIAARSILATEAGGDLYDFLEDDDGKLWIAVGDVSGHGYSCAIAQAMTKAGLASIVRAGETPASVLQQLDRVLRRSGSPRTFTSLVLVRLDLKTGEAVWSNAGNPYPILVSTRGGAEEIVSSSLPLGVGPARRYEDRPLAIPPGGALVFFSDGLYEARNEREEPMGFEPPISIIEKTWRRPAAAILDALVVAWRDHVGLAEVDDDTTVVVVRRNL